MGKERLIKSGLFLKTALLSWVIGTVSRFHVGQFAITEGLLYQVCQ